MDLISPAFAEGERLPACYATTSVEGGENRSVPYEWSGVPEGTRSLALALVDESPVAHRWVHWFVSDIPAQVTGLAEGSSGTSAMPQGARELANTRGTSGYSGPQPPPGSGEHPYVATLYALDVPELEAPQQPTADEIERAVSGHVLERASLTGYFAR